MKIKEVISKVSVEIKELIKKFPVTLGLIAAVTIIVTVIAGEKMEKYWDRVAKICIFLIIFGVGTYFIETFFEDKKKKIIGFGVTAGISFGFTNCLFMENIQNSLYASFLYRSLVAYIICVILLTIYHTIRKEKLTFSQYLLHLFRDLLGTGITYGILSFGFLMLYSIFVSLILDGSYGSGIWRIQILLFGLYYVPAVLYSISAQNKLEVNSFVKGLIIGVLMPLVVIAMGIVYLYIAKIIILRSMPKNIIYRILAGIFVVAYPVWNMAMCYSKEKKMVEKICKILPYLYIPFLLLEMYSIGTRIQEFGITPLRYISCAFILFQIIAIGLNIYKNAEMQTQLYIVSAVLVTVLLITPLNYERISNLDQKRRIEMYLKEETEWEQLSQSEQKIVKSAYQYLEAQDYSEMYIPNYITEDMKKKLLETSEFYNNIERNQKHYFYHSQELDLDIERYKHIKEIEGESNDGKTLEDDSNELKVDIENYLKDIIKAHKISEKNAEKYFNEHSIISTQNSDKFIFVENINLVYEKEEQIDYLTINGYLLEK